MASIIRTGSVQQTALVYDESGTIRLGTIQVRTGDVVSAPPGPDLTNAIAFAYSGGRMGTSHWVQFIWFEMIYTVGGATTSAAGSIRMTGSPVPVPLTVPGGPKNWILDSGCPTQPFYDGPNGGISLATNSMITIWDEPGGASALPMARTIWGSAPTAGISFWAHAKTYLVQDSSARLQIDWAARTDFAPGSGPGAPSVSPVAYSMGSLVPVSSFAPALQPLIGSRYSAYRSLR